MQLIPFSVYINEIVNFLRTVTIKFTPFIDLLDRSAYRYHGIPMPTEDKERKYYKNLTGQYHTTDTIMKVYSIDTQTDVVFDRQMFIDHPKTGSLYNIVSNEYKHLVLKYPDQADLIKNIVYPACDGNIEDVIAAPNLSLLAYDISLLHNNEQESLIVHLIEYLDYINHRWFFNNYYFEDLYYPAFWGILWPNLALTLLVKRMLNIKTNNAHPFHIWEHLTSNGLGDYRTILTDKQALYLYRNIEHILRNRGKMTNLYILTENLLKDHYISLIAKQLYQSIDAKAPACITTPEIINKQIVDYRQNISDTENYTPLLDFEYRLYNEQLEDRLDDDYLLDLETRLGITHYNVLQTKFLELQKDPVFAMYIGFMAEFLLDTLMFKYASGKLNYIVIMKDPLSNIYLELKVGQAIALLHYALHKSCGSTPTHLPKYYVTRTCYEPIKPDKSVFPTEIQINNVFFKIAQELDIDKILTDIPWNNDTFYNKDQFGVVLSAQFDIMMQHVYSIQTNASTLYNMAMTEVYDKLIRQELLTFTLDNITTYEEWFKSSDDLISVFSMYHDVAQDSLIEWDKLVNALLDALIPTDDKLMYYSGYIMEPDRLYEGLKDLLKQLSSVNVEYLDTSRAMRYYLTLRYLSLAYVGYTNEDVINLYFNKSIEYAYISGLYAQLGYLRKFSYQYDSIVLKEYKELSFSPTMNRDQCHLYAELNPRYSSRQTQTNFTHIQTTNYNFGVSIDMSSYTTQ
jgi:hypothetical protein